MDSRIGTCLHPWAIRHNYRSAITDDMDYAHITVSTALLVPLTPPPNLVTKLHHTRHSSKKGTYFVFLVLAHN